MHLNRFLQAVFSSLILIKGLLFGSIGLAAVVNINVDSQDDEVIANGNCTLREAIAAVNAGTAVDTCPAGSINTADTNIINLPAGTYTLSLAGREEYANNSGDLNIMRQMQIVGAAMDTTIIDANLIDRAIQIHTTQPVLISNLTIKNGKTEDPGGGTIIFSGGAIKASNADITLNSVNLTNNASALDGGAISVKDSDLTIIDSVINNNHASWSAGAISAYCDTNISAGYSNLTINNSRIAGNTGGFSGAIQTNRTTTIISHSTFKDNQSSNEAGAIRLFNSLVTVNQSSFISNLADNGGAIRNQSNSTLNVNNSTFSQNKANTGGAISADQSAYFYINNSTITSNSADVGSGIYIEGIIDRKFIKNSIVAGNFKSQDISLNFISQGNNILQNTISQFFEAQDGDQLGVDPMLQQLQEYAPNKFIHTLLPGSPAIDAGNATACTNHDNVPLTEDQVGAARPVDGNLDATDVCDIGASEYVYSPNLIYSPISDLRITESGNSVEVFVSLTEIPSAEVTADFIVSDNTEAELSTNSLTFDSTNWNTPQPLVITGIEDTEVDGEVKFIVQTSVLESLDVKYNGVDPPDIPISNHDNDDIEMIVHSTDHIVYENEFTEEYTNVEIELLGTPMQDVTVYITVSDFTQGRLWNNPNSEVTIDGVLYQTMSLRKGFENQRLSFSVYGVNDDEVDGDKPFQVILSAKSQDRNFDGLQLPAINFTNVDNDQPVVQQNPTGNGGGGGAVYFPMLLILWLLRVCVGFNVRAGPN